MINQPARSCSAAATKFSTCKKCPRIQFDNSGAVSDIETQIQEETERFRVLSIDFCDFLNHTLEHDDDEFRFNDASTHEGHLRQNGKLTWFCNETARKISHICIKCKTRTNLKIKAVILC